MPGTPGRSGGQRVGAGRPRKTEAARWLGGNAGRRRAAAPAARPTVPSTPLPPVPIPAGLSGAEQAVWQRDAPLALAARTLTPGTAADFAVLCALEVEMVEVLAARREEGWTTRGMFLAKEFRGLVQRVEAKRRAFKIAPMGKEMVPPEAPKDEWSEFDEPTVQ
jgi:hypothetical protein